MADHRMFSRKIIGSARFLRMPASSRLLYYDLGMAADDDGVVEAYTVLTTTKSSEDDLRVLVTKGFVRILNEDLVAQIMDWRINNIIRADRYHESIYKDLLLQMPCQPADNQLTTKRQPTDNQMEPEVKLSKDKLSKDKLSKDNNKRFAPPTLEEVKAYIAEKGYSVDAKEFFDYYNNENWTDSKGQKVKNWKGRLATWSKKEPKRRRDFQEREVKDEDFADLFIQL